MAGFQNIDVRFVGTLSADGRLTGDYSMDVNREIHPDHPIVYAIDVQRQ